MIKLNQIKINSANPRLIKDDRFKKLVQSVKEFPKMLELRPIVIDEDGTILGGNMRFRALLELGYKEIPDSWVRKASELTDEEKQRFIIEDNVPFGDWDWDTLANEWDVQDLKDWGLEMPVWEGGPVSIDDLGLKDNAFAEEANKLSFSITFNFPISEKQAFDAFDKLELENVLKNFVYAKNVKYINL